MIKYTTIEKSKRWISGVLHQDTVVGLIGLGADEAKITVNIIALWITH